MIGYAGNWVDVRLANGTVRRDWVPAEQPAPMNGSIGEWHVVATASGGTEWEWFPVGAPSVVHVATPGLTMPPPTMPPMVAQPMVTPPMAQPVVQPVVQQPIVQPVVQQPVVQQQPIPPVVQPVVPVVMPPVEVPIQPPVDYLPPPPMQTTRTTFRDDIDWWPRLLIAGAGILVLIVIAILLIENKPDRPVAFAPTAVETTTDAAYTPTSTQTPTYLTAEQFGQLLKDPDSMKGGLYYLYGHIAQFDAATGPTRFLAETSYQPQTADQFVATGDSNRMLFDGDRSVLSPAIQGNLFRAVVEVQGATTYKNTMGGQRTVPLLDVSSIEVLG